MSVPLHAGSVYIYLYESMCARMCVFVTFFLSIFVSIYVCGCIYCIHVYCVDMCVYVQLC